MRAISQYSSMVVPHMLTNTTAPRSRNSGSLSRTNRWTPMPCSPIAFSMPAGVSTIRGGGWPSRSLRNNPLTATPPSVDRSTTSAYSTPYPKHPLAAISGLASVSDPIETERFMSVCERVPENSSGIEHRAIDARAYEMRRAGWCSRQHDTAVAATKAAAHHLLQRHVTPAAIRGGKCRHRSHHRRWTTRIQPDVSRRRCRLECALEWSGDKPAAAAAAVLGCENGLDVQSFEQVHVSQFGGGPCAIKEARPGRRGLQRFGQCDKRREPDTSRDHPSLSRGRDRLEWTPKRPEAPDVTTGRRVIQQGCSDTDALV